MSKKAIKLSPKQQAEILEKYKEVAKIIELGEKLNKSVLNKATRPKKGKIKFLFDGTNQTGNFISGLAFTLLVGPKAHIEIENNNHKH